MVFMVIVLDVVIAAALGAASVPEPLALSGSETRVIWFGSVCWPLTLPGPTGGMVVVTSSSPWHKYF